jgi:glycosyltransferase involved in cell wall biosynthesis
LIENPVMRIKMGKNGRQWVTKNFDRNIVWDRLIEVYERMLTNSQRSQNE